MLWKIDKFSVVGCIHIVPGWLFLARDCYKLLHALSAAKFVFSVTFILVVQLAVMARCAPVAMYGPEHCMGLWPVHLVREATRFFCAKSTSLHSLDWNR